MDSTLDLREAAAQWVARRESENWSKADEAELALWLNVSTAHRVAFMRAEVMWEAADRLQVLGAGLEREGVPTLQDWKASPFFKHLAVQYAADTPAPAEFQPASAHSENPATEKWSAPAWRRTALAAGVVLLGILGVYTLRIALPQGKAYSTPLGVTAAVPMSDGSKITLNTESFVRVAVTTHERDVSLEQGEAFFEVAKDPRRPFVVTAGDRRIVAVGTEFSVRRDGADVRVVVTQGQVRIERGDAPTAQSSAQLSAGSVARATASAIAVQEKSPSEVAELLSWRSGYVVLHETSLADAAVEFNRYNSRKIVIADAAVADLRISGNFRSTNVESFVELLEAGYPITVHRQEERIVLHRR